MDLVSAINLLLALTNQAGKVSALIRQARAEGRGSLTDAEVDDLVAETGVARSELEAAIERARAEGR